MDLDRELSKLVENICDEFYWEGADPETVREEEFPLWLEEIKQTFTKAGWTKPDPTRILGDE